MAARTINTHTNAPAKPARSFHLIGKFLSSRDADADVRKRREAARAVQQNGRPDFDSDQDDDLVLAILISSRRCVRAASAARWISALSDTCPVG